jgi:GNAT superfamily N-acetyltransferase
MLIRPIKYRDLETVRKLYDASSSLAVFPESGVCLPTQGIHRLYGPLKLLSVFPNPLQHSFDLHVAQMEGQVVGFVQVRPSNARQSTWKVEDIAVLPALQGQGIGTRLLRHVFEYYRQGRNWIVEVNIHNRSALALYRQNGFQPLAKHCYWRLSPGLLSELARTETVQSANFLPVSNADAALLCHLNDATTPGEVRQIYSYQPADFYQTFPQRFVNLAVETVQQVLHVRQYVYEFQRQVAIGSLDLWVSKNGLQPHRAHLVAHSGYTWLYPLLAAQVARILQNYPPQDLHLVSADYEAKFEEFLEQNLAAEVLERKLLMSRSVWHKVPEVRKLLESLQLPEMLPGFSLGKPLPEPIQRHETNQDPPSSNWPL